MTEQKLSDGMRRAAKNWLSAEWNVPTVVARWANEAAALEAELARLRERQFPMQDGPAIPWSMAERIYFVYADLFGTDQSLERLAERGGFFWGEIPILRRDYQRKHGRFPDWTAMFAVLEMGGQQP